jgi:Na+/H+-dicarboxylate symporter
MLEPTIPAPERKMNRGLWIGLVAGVLLDMGRTVLNVTGDLLCALFLAQGEPPASDQ